MRPVHYATSLLATCIMIPALVAAPAEAQQSTPAHAHLRHAADEFRGTPEGAGLLTTANAEARIAHQHATLAGRDSTSLEGMQRHMPHVIHAIDPTQVEAGPGLGYGVIAAANGAARHTELAAASEGASDAIETHAIHVATAARSAASHAGKAVELAESIQNAESAEVAAELLAELTKLTDAILNGTDADGDGRIGWQDGEGGLSQADTHMGLIKRAEGIGG